MWIQSSRDEKLVIGEFRAEQFDVMECARVLAGIRRFSNHTHTPYNVADHSVRVCEHVQTHWPGRPSLHMAALMHDAAEAYSGFGDVTRPAKQLAPVISQIEDQIARQIEKRLGLFVRAIDHREVKKADAVLLATEQRDLMGEPPESWHNMAKPMRETITPRTEHASAAAFIAKYEELVVALSGERNSGQLATA